MGPPVSAIEDKLPDLSSHQGAAILAARLRAFWGARGFTVKPIIEEGRCREGRTPADERPIYCVRSDLVAGLPQSGLWA